MEIPQLTFTRFLASISIVILHYGLFTWPMNTSFFSHFNGELISAMSYFFLLSGFILVVSSAKDKSLPDEINSRYFWKKRAARILPVYLFALIIFFCINFKYDPSIPLKWQIQSYYHSIFLLQSWKYKMALDVNYPAWSLSVEAFFYFIFPWVYSNLRNLVNKRLIIISLVAWVLNTYIFISLLEDNAPANFAKFFPLLHVATFVAGVCSGILFVRNYQWLLGKGKQYILAITGVVGLVVLYTTYKDYDIYNYQHNGLLAPLFVFVIYSLAIMKGVLIRILASKPFVFLGSISYSIYILQYPVLQICEKYIPYLKGRETKDIFYVYFIILICCSAITYLFIEKPARVFLTKRKSQVAG